MHRRYEHGNIPIEIIRTFVAVVENGSFSKAGQALGLSQPAITSQMKRLQTLVGGATFDRARGGTALSPRGTLVMTHAKRILQENDQLLSLGGGTGDPQPIRVGLPTVYIDAFLRILVRETWHDQITLMTTHTNELEKNFADGYLDVVCVLYQPQGSRDVVCEWEEPFVWVRSRNFVLSPGSPVPVVSWPRSPQAQPAVTALENSGSAYRLVFSSYDYRARLAAVAAGLGLMTMPERQVELPLVVARDYYLPPMPPLCVGVRLRKGLPDDRADKVLALLKRLRPEVTEKSHHALAHDAKRAQPPVPHQA